MRRRVLEAARREPIEMPRWPAERWPVLPFRLEELTVAKPHQDRIERSRPQTHLQAELIPIPPRRRIGGQSVEHLDGLRRRTARTNRHDINSTYIEKRVNATVSGEFVREAEGLTDEFEVHDTSAKVCCRRGELMVGAADAR
jgi:hypothetical protein